MHLTRTYRGQLQASTLSIGFGFFLQRGDADMRPPRPPWQTVLARPEEVQHENLYISQVQADAIAIVAIEADCTSSTGDEIVVVPTIEIIVSGFSS